MNIDTEKELTEVRERTERNRKAIPPAVLHALEKRSVTLDDVLKMTRQEFEQIFSLFVLEDKPTHEEMDRLINFKHQSMTLKESFIYEKPTEEEIKDMEDDDEEFKRSNDFYKNAPSKAE